MSGRKTGFGQEGSGGNKPRSGFGFPNRPVTITPEMTREEIREELGMPKPKEKISPPGKKDNYRLKIDSIPVEGGGLEIEVECVEFTNPDTDEKRYEAHISVGESANLNTIKLSSKKDYALVTRRLCDGEYDARVVNGIVEVVPRDLDF